MCRLFSPKKHVNLNQIIKNFVLLILFLFFRSLYAVLFTFLVIGITVLWTMGTIVLLGYKMTLLTAIMPALIIVISIPNCIYMYNKYHQEIRRHSNKIKALNFI